MAKYDPIRILQIGDVHYPGAISSRPEIDLKRDPFDVSDTMAPEGLRLRKIASTLSHYGQDYFDIVTFMGDFTTGNPDVAKQMEGMDKCLEYLDVNIVKPLLGRDRRQFGLFVPGNHDVDRTCCPSTPATRTDKFNHYQNALLARGFVHHSTVNPSRIEVKKDDGEVCVWGINTCIGCGEFMSFPQAVKDSLVKKLAAVIKRGASSSTAQIVESFLDFTERLDAPLVEAEILHRLDTDLSKAMRERPNAVQLIVGHHNLLPQVVPRVAPFSELMNSGELRQYLTTKDAPVVYLHGHIHDDPIEIVFSQERPESCVISISAPEFSDGYNIVEVHFDDEGSPLGVMVHGVRQSPAAKIAKLEPRRIPFRQGKHRIAAITSLARDLFYQTFAHNAQLHFNDVRAAYLDQDDGTIERALIELEWLGLVQIANRSRSPRQWNVGSAI